MNAFWRCGICMEEISEPDAVCHHCGRLLCKGEKCRVVLEDPLFGKEDGSSRKTVHCVVCHRTYHSGAAAV